MKLVIDEAVPFIKSRFPSGVDTLYLPGNEITQETVKEADAVIVRTRTICDEKLLKDSKVKLVVTATIGTDHIDIDWCNANGVVVRNAPGCNAPGVAQYVLASLFKTGFDPVKDTLGIIGYGHVGAIVADWANQIGIKVLISDAPRKAAGFDDVEYLPMEEILKKADAVTLHVPLNKEGTYPTFHLIGERELDLMKPGATLVNSSRGGVVDESALKSAIKSGKVEAIIDTWENEPKIDSELAILAAVATPHIAGYSAEGKMRATRMALEAVSETLRIPVDITGLECVAPGDNKISRQLIERSYDPFKDSENLFNNLSAFESLRNLYQYRHEPLFM